MSIYLDYNASTPVDSRVLEKMMFIYKNNYGNADSRTHDFGESARIVVEDARANVASVLNIKKDEIFFTSGATESNNIAILGLREYSENTGNKHIITTSIEHKAILEPLEQLKNSGYDITYISPDNSGRIDSDKLLNCVRDDTLLVSVMHVNNETGIIQPVKEIGEALEGKDVFFHIDAAQSFGKLINELQNAKYDMLSASSHKMYGPQGIGTLVLRKKRFKLPPVKAIMFGGSQEHGIRPGTLPIALIAGFGEACKIAVNEYESNIIKYQNTKKLILQLLDVSNISYSINGDQNFAIPNTLNIALHGVNSEALMLATKQYCGISNGSACNSHSYKPSHVLTAMGFDLDRIQSSVRISWGNQCDVERDFAKLLDSVKSFI